MSRSFSSPPEMFINAESLLPYLKDKVRLTKSDASRHLLCPTCEKRTKLNTLGDGRRKCTICGKKFRINKLTEQKRLLQYAQMLLCFCLDFSVQQAALLTHNRNKVVTTFYSRMQTLLAQHAKDTKKLLRPSKSFRPEARAQTIIHLLPKDFLVQWSADMQE